LLTSLTLAAGAGATTLTPVADTFVTIHSSLGSTNSNHGSDTTLFVIANFGQPVATQSLVRFDLSAYAGQIVQGPVTFSMHVQGTDFGNPNAADRNIGVGSIGVAWDEYTVTRGNFVPVAAPLTQQSVHYVTSADDGYVSWTLPAAYVQTWIDAPVSNNGLLIENLSGGPLNDLQFGSRESANPPLLTFTVPEPSALAALCVGAVGVIGRKRGLRSR
jgi:hypothetical protein